MRVGTPNNLKEIMQEVAEFGKKRALLDDIARREGSKIQDFVEPYAEALLCVADHKSTDLVDSRVRTDITAAIVEALREVLLSELNDDSKAEIAQCGYDVMLGFITDYAKAYATAMAGTDNLRRLTLVEYSSEWVLDDIIWAFSKGNLFDLVRSGATSYDILAAMYDVFGYTPEERTRFSLIAYTVMAVGQ